MQIFHVPLTLGCQAMVLKHLLTIQGYLAMALGCLATI